MVTTYSTASEGAVHGSGDDNVRRRSTRFNTTKSDATDPPSRRPSMLDAPRRKLPWLDDKSSSGREDGSRASHVPGAFISDDDDTSWTTLGSNVPSSPHQSESQPEPRPAAPIATLHLPKNTEAAYTPSLYSTGDTSVISDVSSLQSLRPHRSYEALVSSPERRATRESESSSQRSQQRRKISSRLGDSAISTPPLSSPPTMKRVTSKRRSPGHGKSPVKPLQPKPAEAGIQRAIIALEHASRSFDKSPSVSSRMDPLLVSDSLDTSADESTTESGASLSPKTGHSSRTAMPPTGPSTENVNTVSQIPARRNTVVSFRNQAFHPGSISETPKSSYERKSVDSIVTDWAYVKSKTPSRVPSPPMPSDSSSTTMPSDLERQESTHWRAWHNNTKRPVYHDDPYYIDRHLRLKSKAPSRNEVHDHIRHHGVPPTPPRTSSLRHRNVNMPAQNHSRRSRRSDHARGIRDRRKEHRSERVERYAGPRRRKPQNPWDDMTAGRPKGLAMGAPARTHVSYRGPQGMELFKRQRRQPIARNWGTTKKRITATIACINTALVGFLIGVYAGEVPRIQYAIADQGHIVIMGNVFLYLGLALTTFFCWPLPLLHGRKPYVLGSLAILLPLQFPQALVVGSQRNPDTHLYRLGLLLPRAFSGLVLGLANINFVTTLLDLFGASLQSANPHEELVFVNDVRRHGGGMGLWLGIWAWSFLASIAVGFMIGAVLIESVDPSWGFYIEIIMIASVLILNVLAPETRRARFRRSAIDLIDPTSEYVYQRIVRGEIKLHISPDGPDWWGQEVAAGIYLSIRMYFQLGFNILATYIAWIYAQFVLIIILLGALLSRDYRWHPSKVGAGITSLALGALLAIPLTKAGLFSRERTHGPRTDSMTFQRQITWTSHMTRRIVFTALLPLAGLAYTLSSSGPRSSTPWILPILFAALIGFLSVLAWAETHGLAMEAFDTSDLQPGANTRHRLQSLPDAHRRRRTPYSCFPRVCAAFAIAHALAFLLAAAATAVGGVLTRHLGAQTSTGVVAAVLVALTAALTAVLWRYRRVQVVPDDVFAVLAGSNSSGGSAGPKPSVRSVEEQDRWRRTMEAASARALGDMEKAAASGGQAGDEDDDWKPVVIGNPSGRMRRVNVLELGRWSRWSEIRRLNRLLRD